MEAPKAETVWVKRKSQPQGSDTIKSHPVRSIGMAGEGGPSNREEEVQITFVRAKDGKKRSLPVWFTVSQGKLELMPMYGLGTKWFLDVEKSGSISLQVKDWKLDAAPAIVQDPKTIAEIKQRFSRKYGEDRVRRYYPNQDIALAISLA